MAKSQIDWDKFNKCKDCNVYLEDGPERCDFHAALHMVRKKKAEPKKPEGLERWIGAEK